jgi:hypothetical protein
MNGKKAVIILVALALVAAGVYLLKRPEGELKVSTDLESAKLSDIWSVIVKAANVQNETANLEWFRLKVEDGKMHLLHLEFNGNGVDGRKRVYFVDVDSSGRVRINSGTVEQAISTRHPAKVFRELDSLGLYSIGSSYTLSVDFEWGDMGFDSTVTPLYLLEYGELKPLREVVFHTDRPVCEIEVCKNGCEVWFLREDLRRASEVVFG